MLQQVFGAKSDDCHCQCFNHEGVLSCHRKMFLKVNQWCCVMNDNYDGQD